MASLWSSSSGESGILRKTDQRDKLEDLLVFGYACKLFRDDEKALEIDQGKHLIPWMADNTLKIDRYDGRGTLSDLTPYESSKEGFDAKRWLGLSESERKIEQLCDEERYFALRTNEEEDELYKEEELKRSNSNQIQYTYSETPKTEGPTLPAEEDDEPYIAPPELDIPVNMTLPSTVKQNARIEKTALFISKEGPQMEILLKTKQSGNPQFAFLTQDDPLYRYYRHVLMAIKTGRYKIKNESKSDLEQKQDDHYLHPSLAPISATPILAPPLPPLTYKPSVDCAYSKLVNRIQGTQPTQETASPDAANSQQLQNQAAYIQHYQQYGYYPQYDQSHPYYAQYSQSNQFEQYQMQYGGFAQPVKGDSNPNPYAQIVSNVKAKIEPNVTENSKETGNNETQNGGYTETNSEIMKAPILYKKVEAQTTIVTVQQPILQPVVTPQTTVVIPKQPLFSLAQYSGSESENDEDEPEQTNALAVVIPPADTQIIIDKMASYVAKNGSDFEAIVRSKGDPRFIFLEPSHVFHPYYKYKLKECNKKGQNVVKKQETQSEQIEENQDEDKQVPVQNKQEDKTEKRTVKIKEKKIITPVCFSIKKPRDTDSVSRDKSALPVEDSTDDEEQNKEEQETVVSQVEEPITSTNENTEVKTENENENSNIIEIEDPIMELIDLTDDLEERRDNKRAEDRLKDKIASAAREKLAAKNRALQLERKKRAAAFLSQLKPQNSTTSSKQETEEIKVVRGGTPEDETNNEGCHGEDISRVVYHIDSKSPSVSDKEHRRSRSSSRHKHKSSYHRGKSHKRSHSHSKKRKRERRSHERKKSKRKHYSRSRSRSLTKHYKSEKKVENDFDKHKSKRDRSSERSSDTSNYESDANPK